MERRYTQRRGDFTRPYRLKDVQIEHPGDNLYGRAPKLQKRLLPANPSSLSFATKEPGENSAKRPKQGPERNGNVTYHEFMTFDQGGSATIASDNKKLCSIVAIQKSKVRAINPKIRPPSIRGNIVKLIDVFERDGDTIMVYKQMDVSLRSINSIPGLEWSVHEIAAVCKEVKRFTPGQSLARSVLLT